ncbi:MAG: hypothetical protein V3U29_08740 [Phycisphaeraceae bacterium]
MADDIPPNEPHRDPSGQHLVLGWSGSYGSIVTAVEPVRGGLGLPGELSSEVLGNRLTCHDILPST